MSSKDEKRRTVPKFGSFKPKAPDKPESEVSPELSHRVTEKQPRDSERPREKSSGRERSRHRSRLEPDPGRILSAERAPKERPRPAAAAKNEIFTIDKRGDPLILRYGSNDRSRVPPYYRYGSGKLLGSTGLLHIHREGAREEFSIRGYREGTSAFRDKNVLLAKAAKTRPRRFKRLIDQPLPPGTEDFIALGPSKKRKRGEEEPESSSDEEGPTYRLIEGPAKAHEDSDSDLETDSDASDRGREVYYITPAKKKSIELSRNVKDRPDDVNAWLELIHLQDELFRENEDDDHIRTKDEIKGLANLKLSMFEKALSNARTSTDREGLLAGLMREGSKVWGPQELAKRWVEATDQHPMSFRLWRARMDFELSNMATFSYENIRQLFIDRLHFLAETLDKAPDKEKADDVADQAVYVFLRLTRFLHDSGFVDLAVGAWQGMLELHFARPTLDEDSRSAAMSSLAEFWDSEAPRIGEVGAEGWRKFVEGGDSLVEPPEAKRHDAQARPHTRNVYKAWAAAERQRGLEARMPARIADEGNEGDPYRVVMFTDIDPFLLFFPSSLLPHIRDQLLDAYLLFCGLPPAFMTGDILKSALNDSFVYGGSLDLRRDLNRGSERVDVLEESHRRSPRFGQDGSHMAISSDVLFSGSNWFSYLRSWRELYDEQDESVERSSVLNTLRQLVRVFGMEELGEYCLAMQWLEEPLGAKKAAKAMLKQYPSSTRLYNAYALIEWGNGNLDVAQKVLASVTGQGLVRPPAASLFSVEDGINISIKSPGSASQWLWNTWAWIELEAGEQQSAVARLCSSIDGRVLSLPISPSLVLKARSHFSGRQDYSLSAGAFEDALGFAISLTLLDYLSSSGGDEPASEGQGNISVAMLRIQAFSDELSSRGLMRSSVQERFLQSAARLIYFHASHG